VEEISGWKMRQTKVELKRPEPMFAHQLGADRVPYDEGTAAPISVSGFAESLQSLPQWLRWSTLDRRTTYR
jgi:hypothetical protein